jgi:hypothetical protein
LIFGLNNQRWKKVQNAKKFKEEYGMEDQSFEDYFRIGISWNQGKIKLYEQFYKSDIIIGK